MENKAESTKKGGLYAKVNMSVKSANIMVGTLAALLVIVSVFIVKHNGFTVKFDTDGGSYIAPVKVMYSETVSPADPVNEWSAEKEVTGRMTLYAGWNEK